MKKTFFSTFLFVLFILFVAISYLSFFGYETSRFNKVIKSEINGHNKKINLDFKEISILLDIKKLTLYVRFIEPDLRYSKISIPLKSLRTDVDVESLIKKKVGIKKIILATNNIDDIQLKQFAAQIKQKDKRLKYIENAKFQIDRLELEFDKDFKLKDNYNVKGTINTAEIKISNKYPIKNLIANFSYKKNNLKLNEISWSFDSFSNKQREFFNGELFFKQVKNNNHFDLNFKTRKVSNFLKLPIMNYSFSEENIATIKSSFVIKKNRNILFKNIIIEDPDNQFTIKDLHLNKNYNLINFDQIKINTSKNNSTNNDFTIKNRDKVIIKGKIFDAEKLLKELSKDNQDNNFLKTISKDIEIDFNKVLKGLKFPIKKFRLVGKINKGKFEKISAKSDFSDDEHLDISLKKQLNSKKKILEVYSDIAMPLLSEYKFFRGLQGGNLLYVSEFSKEKSSNELTINDFKLSDAPALAKLLTLADLKGITDALKGEGISFETMSIKYETDSSTMRIEEIFMIGPSISLLIDGYIEKKSGLVSLRGTLVPAKTLNTLVSKIPVVGDILVGKKVGEGIFGLSFKIKGLPDDLKTTVNPIKTLAPRFITRAVESAKKRGTK